MATENHCEEARARAGPITGCWNHSRRNMVVLEFRPTEE